MDCIFCKIVAKEIPAKIIYEDDDVLVFPDINPVRKVHMIIIPKTHIREFIAVEDTSLFQKLFTVVQYIVQQEALTDKGYRIITNGGGAQVVNHLHIHLMGPITKTVKL